MWFLASLLTTVGAAYTYRKVERSSSEIAVVCVAVGLIALVLSLIVAPWQVQLALLIGTFISSRFI